MISGLCFKFREQILVNAALFKVQGREPDAPVTFSTQNEKPQIERPFSKPLRGDILIENKGGIATKAPSGRHANRK